MRISRTTWRPAVVFAAAGAVALASLTGTGAATASEPDRIVVADGVTQPVFDYGSAIREVVQVTSPVNSHDGEEPDIIVVDIIRPAASDDGLNVPTIIIPSPYYSGPGRGGTVNRAGERKPTPPATPSIVAGDEHFGGNRLTPARPVTGQEGNLVGCGLALSADDCPAGAAGGIALVERGVNTLTQKVQNAAAAGAVGVVIYNNVDGAPRPATPARRPVVRRERGSGRR